MPIPAIALILAGVGAAGLGVGAAVATVKEDRYTKCVRDLIKLGISPSEATQRCIGRKEPPLAERILSPILLIAGAAIAGPPLVEYIRKALKQKT